MKTFLRRLLASAWGIITLTIAMQYPPEIFWFAAALLLLHILL